MTPHDPGEDAGHAAKGVEAAAHGRQRVPEPVAGVASKPRLGSQISLQQARFRSRPESSVSFITRVASKPPLGSAAPPWACWAEPPPPPPPPPAAALVALLVLLGPPPLSLGRAARTDERRHRLAAAGMGKRGGGEDHARTHQPVAKPRTVGRGAPRRDERLGRNERRFGSSEGSEWAKWATRSE